jgi:hypothetical protein
MNLTANPRDYTLTANERVTGTSQTITGGARTRVTRSSNRRVTRAGNVRVTRGIFTGSPILLVANPRDYSLTANERRE